MVKKFFNSSISHIYCTLPDSCYNLLEYSSEIGIDIKEAKKIIETTGINKIRLCKKNQLSSDLCYDAAKKILKSLSKDEVNEIDAVIYVSQTRDYIMPQTSNIIQNKLNLKTDIICLDIPLGCSGYVYGLFQSNLYIDAGCRKVLLLAGDTSSKMISKNDKTVSMVFGDAGSATLIVNKKSKSYFDIGNDGKRYKDLIIYDGGFRNPYSSLSFKKKKIGDGIIRSNSDLFMDGFEIMNFAIKRVPKSINNLLNYCDINKSSVNLFFLHQANKFMLTYLAKKMKINSNKVPFLATNYGNTGPASIPLAICEYLNKNKLKYKRQNIILSGFGVGLSWASSLLEINNKLKINLNFTKNES